MKKESEKFVKPIANIIRKHKENNDATPTQVAWEIIEYWEKEEKNISSKPLAIKLLPSEPTDIEILIQLHHHLDICGHNINSNLKERLREMIKRGNDIY